MCIFLSSNTALNSVLLFFRAPIQKEWHFWLYAFVLVYLTFPYLRLFEEPGLGLDPSWQIALNLLREKQGMWGKDFVFNYGPLGSFIYRLPIQMEAWRQYFYDAFFLGNLFYFYATCFPKNAKYYHFIFVFACNLFSFEMIGETTAFLWMFLGVYHGFVALYTESKWKRMVSLILAFTLLGIIFFTKSNYGIIGWPFLLGLFVVMVIIKQIKWWIGLTYVGIAVLGLMVWAAYLNTNLLLYCTSSLHIIATYNAGMSVFPEAYEKLTALTYAFFSSQFFISIYLVYRASKQSWRTYFLMATGLGISFVLLKYSFVRADSGHFTAYIKLMTYVCILISAFAENQLLKQVYLWLMPLLFFFYVGVYAPLVSYTPLGIRHGIKYRPFILSYYFKGTREEAKSSPKLPASFLTQIKNQPVDVIPFEISWIYNNKLNYAPRPTLQSYVAADRYLDSLNEVYMASNHAPQYVIYGLEKSELKYPWSEESFTQKALFTHYRIVDSNDSLLLFKRQANARKLRFVFTQQSKHRIGDVITLDALQAGYLRETSIETSYSSLGNVANLLFQPPQLMAELTSGEHRERVRFAPNLMKKGFWSNSLILNLAQAKVFYTQQADSSNTLESIKFSEGQFFHGGFKPEILVTHRYYKIE
jgi:hypothetical protein